MAVNTNRAARHGRKFISAQASFSRPADVTPYSIGDAVSDSTNPALVTSMQFPVSYIDGGHGMIRTATLHKTAQNLTLATFELLLFHTEPAIAGFEDNGALAITDAEFLDFIGSIPFPAANGISVVTGDTWTESGIDLPYDPGASTKAIFGVLMAGAAYVPASAETISIRLGCETD